MRVRIGGLAFNKVIASLVALLLPPCGLRISYILYPYVYISPPKYHLCQGRLLPKDLGTIDFVLISSFLIRENILALVMNFTMVSPIFNSS
ncbi:hypothetical protein MtrunA17_Chr6g0457901 [Medicago truncatula]|uniref:Uncharacterized protein n=1 Tax=Medicago truncatula TaxID=3880 RepID=A0A396HCV7_MEDTR|nr:hypothetical protein MtrunA17_Chr6g0457901 [Medicago truncatula]